jgi:hypothetical protein
MVTVSKRTVADASLMALKRTCAVAVAAGTVAAISYLIVTPYMADPFFTFAAGQRWSVNLSEGSTYFILGVPASYIIFTPVQRYLSSYREGKPGIDGSVAKMWENLWCKIDSPIEAWVGARIRNIDKVSYSIRERKKYRWLPLTGAFEAAYLSLAAPTYTGFKLLHRFWNHAVNIAKFVTGLVVTAGLFGAGYELMPRECDAVTGSAIFTLGAACGYLLKNMNARLFGLDQTPKTGKVEVRHLPGINKYRAERLRIFHGITVPEEVAELEPGVLAAWMGISFQKAMKAVKAGGKPRCKNIADLPHMPYNGADELRKNGITSVYKISKLQPIQISQMIGVSLKDASEIKSYARPLVPPRSTLKSFTNVVW